MAQRQTQRFDLAQIAIALLIVFISAGAFAKDKTPKKDCDPASNATETNAKALGLMVAAEIAQLEEQHKAQGKDLRVVLVARGAQRSLEDIRSLGTNNWVRPDRSGQRIQVYVPDLPHDMTSEEFVNSGIYKEIRDACKKYASRSGGKAGGVSGRSGTSDRQKCLSEGIKYGALPQPAGERGKLDYFHVGIALKAHPETDKVLAGYWGMVHELKPSCRRHDQEEFTRKDFNKEKPYIYEESLKNYFLEKLDEYKAVVIVPTPEVQTAIEKLLIGQKERSKQFVGDRYNAAALVYQNGLRNDQNSNQWVAEIIAAAQNPAINTRQEAQALLRQQNFMPTKIDANSDFIYSVGKSVDALFNNLLNWDIIDSVNVKGHALKDHGIVEVVTVRSIQNYLSDNDFLVSEHHIKIPPALVKHEKNDVK